MENVKHFVFDLTSDVTGDLEVKFLNFIWKSRPGLSIAVWIFPPRLLVSEIDGGGATGSPQQRVGAGLGPLGRGLTFTPGVGVILSPCVFFLPTTQKRRSAT